jgi:hypothetical protein
MEIAAAPEGLGSRPHSRGEPDLLRTLDLELVAVKDVHAPFPI